MSFLKRSILLSHDLKLWAVSHKKVLVGSAGLALVVILGIQLMHPESEALPGARFNGQLVAGSTKDELLRRVNTDFTDATVSLKAGNAPETTLTLVYMGAVLAADETVEVLTGYPLWQRLVPLSLVLKRPHVKYVQAHFSEERLSEVAKQLSETMSIPAEDARLSIENGALVVTESRTGQRVTAEDVITAVTSSKLGFGNTPLEIPHSEIEPAVQDEDIEALRSEAEKVIQRRIVIVAPNGKEFIPTPSDISAWITVAESEAGKPALAANGDGLQQYVSGLNEVVGTKPGSVRATLVDGEEIARTTAPSGVAIASDELTKGLADAMFSGSADSTRLAITMVPVDPNVVYDRSYTSSQKGLRSYVDHVSATEHIKIAVSQTKAGGWSAYGRADEQIVAASTYKLYVAHMLFEQVKQGKLSWSDAMQGTDVNGCFERMIVHSDNPCAEEFVEKFGGRAINSLLYSKGLSQTTTFISDVAAQTTAADLEKFLRGVESGNIVAGSDQAKLLDAMSRQRFRSGVPAGATGTVQNKVGFIWDYINDAAIVRHPKGTYVIVVLTKGASWQRVAEVTKQIEQIMYS